jgi:hypothetical protein
MTIQYCTQQLDKNQFATLTEAWKDLTCRAIVPNVFSDPAVIEALGETTDATLTVVLVWQLLPGDGVPRLVGAWPLSIRRPFAWLPLRALVSPLHCLCYLGTPVVDRSCPYDVFKSMLVHLSGSKLLPKTIFLGDISIDSTLIDAFDRAVDACGLRYVELGRKKRAMLQSCLQAKEYLAASISGQRIKKLRQHRRRLAEAGGFTASHHRSFEEVVSAFEEFLKLECAGWKGKCSQRGRAMVRHSSRASFARAMIKRLAEADHVTIHALRVQGRPAAMQIVLYCGFGAFTWMTAYDESLHRCSPGILLLEDCTRMLLADRSITFTDSCNPLDVGYMAEFWKERLEVMDICIALRPGLSPSFWVLVAAEKLRRRVKTMVRRLYHAGLDLVRAASRRANAGMRAFSSEVGTVRVKKIR